MEGEVGDMLRGGTREGCGSSVGCDRISTGLIERVDACRGVTHTRISREQGKEGTGSNHHF